MPHQVIPLEKKYAKQFIDALKRDQQTQPQRSKINVQVLEAAIYLIQNRSLYPQLSLEQLIRGTLNMALALSHRENYLAINSRNVGEEKSNVYLEEQSKWFGDYYFALHSQRHEPLGKIQPAFAVIECAAKSPLFMIRNCVPSTLSLYFEYANQLDKSFPIPDLPLLDVDNNPRFEIVRQEVNKPYPDEETVLLRVLNNLSEKVETIKKGTDQTIVAVAEALRINLGAAVASYLASGDDPNLRKLTKQTFVETCTAAIKGAKPILETELGWGDLLINLLKTLVNVVIAKTNTIVGSNFSLFTQVKAPLIREIEAFEQDVDNIVNAP